MDTVSNIENGSIYFFYRRNIQEEFPDASPDIQHFFMVLNPQDQRLYRLVVLGKRIGEEQELPLRLWGMVSKVTALPEQIESEIEPKRYQTKSRGERQLKASRLCGEGLYRIVRHENHTHFTYSLKLPENPDEIAKELLLENEASFIIRVRNPDKPSPKNIGTENAFRPEYPARLWELFQDRRFINADPVEYLNYEGTGLMLITAAHEHVNTDLELEPSEEEIISIDIINQLREDRNNFQLEPLIRGRWR